MFKSSKSFKKPRFFVFDRKIFIWKLYLDNFYRLLVIGFGLFCLVLVNVATFCFLLTLLQFIFFFLATFKILKKRDMFSPLDAELYVKLSPLTDTDHRYVIRCRNNPIQRFKVSFNTQLNTIASYVLARMAGQNIQQVVNGSPNINNCCLNCNYNNCNANLHGGYGPNNSSTFSPPVSGAMRVTLSVQRLGSFVSVPLSITISDLMMMTSMKDEALLFYAFVQPSSQRIVSSPTNNIIDSCVGGNQMLIENNYPTSQIYPMTPQKQYQTMPLTPPSQLQSSITSPAPSPPQIYSSPMMFSSSSVGKCPQQQVYYQKSNYQPNINSFQSPPVVKNQRSTSPNWAEVPTSPSCTLFHTGISMYADSFGTMPPSFGFDQSSNSFSNSYSSSLNGEEQSRESIKLKESLEALIHRSSQVNSC